MCVWKRAVGVSLLALFSGLLLTGCEDDPVTLPADNGNQVALENIVGRWAVDQSSEPVFPSYVVFYADGSWRMEGVNYGAGSFVWEGGTWLMKGNDWYDRWFSGTIAVSQGEMVVDTTRWWFHAVAVE